MRARRETTRSRPTQRARDSLARVSERIATDGSETKSEVYAALSAEAQYVMDNSTPIPTQAENDALRTGQMVPDDITDPDNPEMPSVAAQQALVEFAAPDGGTDPPAQAAPTVIDVPAVTGNGEVGETLACTMGNWDGEPTSYAYAWQSDGTPNAATGPTYGVVPGDAGHAIACVVTAQNAAGSTAAPASNAITVAGTRSAQRQAPRPPTG